jgi:hypothetical protein
LILIVRPRIVVRIALLELEQRQPLQRRHVTVSEQQLVMPRVVVIAIVAVAVVADVGHQHARVHGRAEEVSQCVRVQAQQAVASATETMIALIRRCRRFRRC